MRTNNLFLWGVAASLLLAGCSNSPTQDKADSSLNSKSAQFSWWILDTAVRAERLPSSNFYVSVNLRKTPGGWITDPSAQLSDESVERLLLELRLHKVYTNYDPQKLSFNEVDKWACQKGLLGNSSRSMGYGPCSSAFTKTEVTVGGTIASAVTLPLQAALGTAHYTVRIDTDEIRHALTESNALREANNQLFAAQKSRMAGLKTSDQVLNFINEYLAYDAGNLKPAASDLYQQYRLMEYRQAYATANATDSIPSLDRFSRTYGSFDPEGLVRQARARHAELQAVEAAETKRAETERAAQRLTAERERLQQVETWRRSIATGAQTSCGPVIEIKGTLVKVYSPVQNYGNEHWIEVARLYPSEGAPCRFINGQYQDP